MRSKRPWKKWAAIRRIELNNGDVKFKTITRVSDVGTRGNFPMFERGTFESLTDAEADLDAWWADWWPQQTKTVRNA